MADAYRRLNRLIAAGQETFQRQCGPLVSRLLLGRGYFSGFPAWRPSWLMDLDLIIYIFNSFFRTFPVKGVRPYRVLQAFLRCMDRVGRDFTKEEIESGELSKHLIPEDFELEKHVSLYFTHLCN